MESETITSSSETLTASVTHRTAETTIADINTVLRTVTRIPLSLCPRACYSALLYDVFVSVVLEHIVTVISPLGAHNDTSAASNNHVFKIDCSLLFVGLLAVIFAYSMIVHISNCYTYVVTYLFICDEKNFVTLFPTVYFL